MPLYISLVSKGIQAGSTCDTFLEENKVINYSPQLEKTQIRHI